MTLGNLLSVLVQVHQITAFSQSWEGVFQPLEHERNHPVRL